MIAVNCRHCGATVELDAAVIDDGAETLLRDHLVLAHPRVLQPATRQHLVLHFQVQDQ